MPRPSRRVLLSLILAALGGGLLFLSLRLWLWQPVPPPPEPPRLRPAVTLTGAGLARFDQNGRKLWELEAARITLEREAEQTTAEEVRLEFFRNGEVVLEVYAPHLLLFNRTGDIELSGGLEAHGEGGLEFRTPRMRWDAKRERLIGDLEVEVKRGENRLTGIGFEYSPKEGKLVLKGGAHLILLPGEE